MLHNRFNRYKINESIKPAKARELLSSNEILAIDFKTKIKQIFDEVLNELDNCSDTDVLTGRTSDYRIDNPLWVNIKGEKLCFDLDNLNITPSEDYWED